MFNTWGSIHITCAFGVELSVRIVNSFMRIPRQYWYFLSYWAGGLFFIYCTVFTAFLFVFSHLLPEVTESVVCWSQFVSSSSGGHVSTFSTVMITVVRFLGPFIKILWQALNWVTCMLWEISRFLFTVCQCPHLHVNTHWFATHSCKHTARYQM
jgi:hypothetical protein